MQSASPFSFEDGPWEAFFSPPLLRRFPQPVMHYLLGTDPHDDITAIDAAIERFLLNHMLGASSVDRVVVLAFDAYHTAAGSALGPARVTGAPGTHLYVSNTYVHDLCRRHPARLWFGASIHPYRPRAIEALDEVAQSGAVLVKWLPLAQHIDAADPRSVAFLEHAARIAMPMLIHYGGEVALPTANANLANPGPLLETLRRLRSRGVFPTTIIAHAATPSFRPFGRDRYFEALVAAMLGEFHDEPLYADLAGLATLNRARWLRMLLGRPELHRKLIHGSDFPVPTFPLLFRRALGTAFGMVARCPSWIERDYQLKRHLGFPSHVFTRFGEILARLGRPTS